MGQLFSRINTQRYIESVTVASNNLYHCSAVASFFNTESTTVHLNREKKKHLNSTVPRSLEALNEGAAPRALGAARVSLTANYAMHRKRTEAARFSGKGRAERLRPSGDPAKRDASRALQVKGQATAGSERDPPAY